MKHHWFLPKTPDLLALLRQQAEQADAGLRAFATWSTGELDQAETVRSAEKAADETQRHLQAWLREAFSTPLDPEDLYELSERLDNVLDAAKNTVREAEVMGMAPDAAMADMARLIADGVAHLCAALTHLGVDADQATTEADTAIKCERTLEKSYRRSMSALLDLDDWKEVAGRRELYRRCARIGDAVTLVAERVWYAVVKER